MIDKHWASGHTPPRNWCSICTAAYGVEDGHYANYNPSAETAFSCDYCFMSGKDDPELKLTIFVIKEHRTKSVAATVVPAKGGLEISWGATYFVDTLKAHGYGNSPVTLKSDNEPAIRDVLNRVIQARSAPTKLDNAPRGDSSGNGHAENAVQQIERRVRALKLALESRYKIKIPPKHYILAWIAQHAAFCYNRFQTGHDGLTPYQRIRGKPFDKPICEFGECVMALRLKVGTVTHPNKLDSRWFSGVFLGFHGLTNEFLIGTPNGIERARTIKRLPVPDRWNVQLLNTFRGLPWKLKDVQSVDDIPEAEYGAPGTDDAEGVHIPPSAMGGTYIVGLLKFSRPI